MFRTVLFVLCILFFVLVPVSDIFAQGGSGPGNPPPTVHPVPEGESWQYVASGAFCFVAIGAWRLWQRPKKKVRILPYG